MTTELPEKPLSRKESYLAAIAGESVELPEAPESRTEQYLAYIAENGGGGGGGTNNFNQLTNRPKYNGTTMTGSTNIPEVKSYSAGTGLKLTGTAFSVDTTTIQPKLTAGSNVTISDNIISATDTTYSNFTGTDGTAAGVAGLVPAPATTDAGKFLKADGTWDTAGGGGSYTAGDGIDITNSVISATNTGKVKVLTTDDYNYPATGTKTSVALWLLEPGLYRSDGTADVRWTSTSSAHATYAAPLYLVSAESFNERRIIRLNTTDSAIYIVDSTSGNQTNYCILTTSIVDALNSSSTEAGLSAKQGKVLKDLIDSLAFKNAGAPTTSTVGTVGQLLEDTTNGKLYICTAIVPGTDPDPDTYTWTEVGAGGGGGGVTELTSADYNYDYGSTGSNNTVALWLKTAGIYHASDTTVNVSPTSSNYNSKQPTAWKNYASTYIVGHASSNQVKIVCIDDRAGDGSNNLMKMITVLTVYTTTGAVVSVYDCASMSDIYADPETQQKIKIGAGTSSSEGNNAIEIGHNAAANKDSSIAFGDGAITGSSSYQSIAIGAGASVNTSSTSQGSIALGAGSGTSINKSGMIDVGSSFTSYGYNSSNYRLLTGLYDPQSAHDAATKGYVDPTTDSSAPTTSTVGRLGQIFIDTTNADAYMCVAVDTVTPSYTWKKINA